MEWAPRGMAVLFGAFAVASPMVVDSYVSDHVLRLRVVVGQRIGLGLACLLVAVLGLAAAYLGARLGSRERRRVVAARPQAPETEQPTDRSGQIWAMVGKVGPGAALVLLVVIEVLWQTARDQSPALGSVAALAVVGGGGIAAGIGIHLGVVAVQAIVLHFYWAVAGASAREHLAVAVMFYALSVVALYATWVGDERLRSAASQIAARVRAGKRVRRAEESVRALSRAILPEAALVKSLARASTLEGADHHFGRGVYPRTAVLVVGLDGWDAWMDARLADGQQGANPACSASSDEEATASASQSSSQGGANSNDVLPQGLDNDRTNPRRQESPLALLHAFVLGIDAIATSRCVDKIRSEGAGAVLCADATMAARNALEALVETALDIRRLAADSNATYGTDLVFRAGLAMGPACGGLFTAAGMLRFDMVGEPVAHARALCTSAHPGAIQINWHVSEAIISDFFVEPCNTYAASGEVVYEVVERRDPGRSHVALAASLPRMPLRDPLSLAPAVADRMEALMPADRAGGDLVGPPGSGRAAPSMGSRPGARRRRADQDHQDGTAHSPQFTAIVPHALLQQDVGPRTEPESRCCKDGALLSERGARADLEVGAMVARWPTETLSMAAAGGYTRIVGSWHSGCRFANAAIDHVSHHFLRNNSLIYTGILAPLVAAVAVLALEMLHGANLNRTWVLIVAIGIQVLVVPALPFHTAFPTHLATAIPVAAYCVAEVVLLSDPDVSGALLTLRAFTGARLALCLLLITTLEPALSAGAAIISSIGLGVVWHLVGILHRGYRTVILRDDLMLLPVLLWIGMTAYAKRRADLTDLGYRVERLAADRIAALNGALWRVLALEANPVMPHAGGNPCAIPVETATFVVVSFVDLTRHLVAPHLVETLRHRQDEASGTRERPRPRHPFGVEVVRPDLMKHSGALRSTVGRRVPHRRDSSGGSSASRDDDGMVDPSAGARLHAIVDEVLEPIAGDLWFKRSAVRSELRFTFLATGRRVDRAIELAREVLKAAVAVGVENRVSLCVGCGPAVLTSAGRTKPGLDTHGIVHAQALAVCSDPSTARGKIALLAGAAGELRHTERVGLAADPTMQLLDESGTRYAHASGVATSAEVPLPPANSGGAKGEEGSGQADQTKVTPPQSGDACSDTPGTDRHDESSQTAMSAATAATSTTGANTNSSAMASGTTGSLPGGTGVPSSDDDPSAKPSKGKSNTGSISNSSSSSSSSSGSSSQEGGETSESNPGGIDSANGRVVVASEGEAVTWGGSPLDQQLVAIAPIEAPL